MSRSEGLEYEDAHSRKITDAHLQRLAVVYVRQSTAQQVLSHRESTRLQYGLGPPPGAGLARGEGSGHRRRPGPLLARRGAPGPDSRRLVSEVEPRPCGDDPRRGDTPGWRAPQGLASVLEICGSSAPYRSTRTAFATRRTSTTDCC